LSPRRLVRCLFFLFLGCTAGAQTDVSSPPTASFRTAGPQINVAQADDPAPVTAPATTAPFRTDEPQINVAQADDPAPAASSAPAASFRTDEPAMKNDVRYIPSGDPGTVGESQAEMDNLSDQKQTLESELLYARSKLDASRKRLDVESMAGHADEATKYQQEVSDWDARVKSLRAQLAEVDDQIQGAIQQMQPPPPTPENTIIVPGDTLEIFVVEDSSFNGRYQVRRGGYIILPAVGRIPVAGKSLSDAENAVRSALEVTQLQHATVMVEKVEGADIQSGPVIYLAGEFVNRRPFTIPNGTKATVISVILSCGGVTDKADLTRVKVMRVVANKSVVEEENVQKILEGNGLTSDLTLNDGDVLVIPSGADNLIYLTGRVMRTGSQPFKEGDKLSVYAAILNAGGPARFADLKKVYVLRASPDGTKVRIPVNVEAIQHGRTADIPVQGNDIIVVPEKFFSW
jgi:protein involved in polysaccharide export with SLBB domain